MYVWASRSRTEVAVEQYPLSAERVCWLELVGNLFVRNLTVRTALGMPLKSLVPGA